MLTHNVADPPHRPKADLSLGKLPSLQTLRLVLRAKTFWGESTARQLKADGGPLVAFVKVLQAIQAARNVQFIHLVVEADPDRPWRKWKWSALDKALAQLHGRSRTKGLTITLSLTILPPRDRLPSPLTFAPSTVLPNIPGLAPLPDEFLDRAFASCRGRGILVVDNTAEHLDAWFDRERDLDTHLGEALDGRMPSYESLLR